MANNKMLIDASHREETRVVVVRGNRIEEFDFEAQDRRQLRGNIYLAKVTRVEPSLQAAFIDYGGNRHGFLAFSEIHPDYYQIPAADRQALLDAEAEAASVEDDDQSVGIEEAASSGNEEDDEEENGEEKKRPRRKSRRGSRGRKSREEDVSAESDEPSGNDIVDGESDTGADDTPEVAAEAETAEQSEEAEAKPKKRTRRVRKPKAAKAETSEENSGSDGADASDSTDNDGDDAAGSGTTMAAMMEIDSISEDAPEEEPDNDTSAGDTSDSVEETEKPKRKTTRRKPAAKKAKAEAAADAADEATSQDAEASDEPEAVEKPKKKRTRRKPAAKKADAETSDEETVAEESDVNADTADAEADEKPKRKPRNGRRRKAKAEDIGDGDDNGDGDETGKTVESVGQEDALEEVAVKRPRRQYKIQEVIRRRQVMLVQVVKEERGNKGAALTTYLSLAGRYSVLMPNTARGGGISRKITNPADRKRLKEIAGSLEVPQGMGVILRTAGAAREREEIERDFDYLMRLWENVRELTLESSAPYLVYEEGSLIKRSIRDLYNKDIGEIIVSGDEGFREAKDFMQMLMPGHGRNVKQYQGEQPLLAKFNIESQLDKMVTPQVTLKSGGYLIINQTEALVAIDVNSGRSTREHSIEATALQTNLEAAEEVARQLRLRDLAGLVVIDFIDMEEKRNNRAVERKLKECLKNDRARIQVGHISHFGLMEMSRQRIRASVLESTMAVCPTCQGVGHIRSEPSFGLHILRGIDDHLTRHSRNDVIVKVPPAIALYILNNKRAAVSDLEDRYGVKISFESDHTIEAQEFTIEKGEPTSRTPRKAAAVNPMHNDQADQADQADQTAEDGSDSASRGSDTDVEADSDDNNKRGRRRRGRGRGRNRDRDDNRNQDTNGSDETSATGAESNGSDTVSAASSEAQVEEADDPGDQSSRKRGRGRSRSNKAQQTDDQGSVEESAAEPVTAEPEEPSEPARRTGRPGKKVKSETEQKADTQPDETGDNTPRNGAPARKVKRRNTRRVAKADKDAPEDGENQSDEPASWSGGFLS